MARMQNIVLAAGYLLAVPFSVFLPGFRRLWRRREPAVLATEEVGAALICLGWGLRRNWPAVLVNATWGLGLAAGYAAEGRKRARQRRASCQ